MLPFSFLMLYVRLSDWDRMTCGPILPGERVLPQQLILEVGPLLRHVLTLHNFAL